MTYQDIRAVGNFKEQTVIAVKAPPQTRLEVPDRAEVSRVESRVGRPGWLCRVCLALLVPSSTGPFWILGQKCLKLEVETEFWPEGISGFQGFSLQLGVERLLTH